MFFGQILGYPLLAISALELFLGFVLLKHNPRKSAVNRSVAAFAFFTSIFSLSTAVMYLRASLGLEYVFFARLNWIGWLAIPAALQAVFYIKDENSSRAGLAGRILYPFWIAVLSLSIFTDLVVTNSYRVLPFANVHGPIDGPLRIAGGLLIFWLVYEIFMLRKAVTGIKRVQLNYFLIGTLIFGIGGSLTAGFLPFLWKRTVEPGLAAYFSFPWVLLTFYAITRYRLFDIHLIISRTANFLFLSFSISCLQVLLFNVLEPAAGSAAAIFISIPAIGVLFFGTPLSRIVQKQIDDVVIRGRFDYQTMLKESANAMITIMHKDELIRFVVDRLRDGLDVDNVCLYILDVDGRYEAHSSYGHSVVEPSFLRNISDNFAQRFAGTLEPVVVEEMEPHSCGNGSDVAATMRRHGIELILPLLSKGQMLGFLTLGKRNNGGPYFQSDMDMLQTVAGHAAVAIENARLFEDKERLFAENVRQYKERIAEQQRHHTEKEKILKDLHDGIGGLTTNVNLLAEIALKNDDPALVKRSLSTIADLSRESLAEIRRFIHVLDDKELTWHAIAAELRHLGNTMIEPHGIHLDIQTSVLHEKAKPKSFIAMNIFRIYKESLANIIKHSKATAAFVLFAVDSDRLVLKITDNGIGMNGKRGNGRGILNMQARAKDMGGTMSIAAENGTQIILEIPIP